MNALKDLIDPKISFGSIAIFAVQFVICAAWLMNDHQLSVDLKAAQAETRAQLEDIRLALPVTNKEIELNGHRIDELEAHEKEIFARLAAIENSEAITRETLVEFHSELADLKQTDTELRQAMQQFFQANRRR